MELKTFYSKQLLARLIPAHKRIKSGWMKRWSTEKRMYSSRIGWVVIPGPCDEVIQTIVDLPKDAVVSTPQSIQYPPGMEPKPAARLSGTNNWTYNRNL